MRLVPLVAMALLAPANALALDSDLKHSAAFKLEASNGYSIVAVASSERANGRGDVFLIVHRRNAFVTYVAPATLTGARVDADLGRLGRISLDVVPSGLEKTVRSPCGAGPETFEPQSYRGSFEFHGEEGYADATVESPREYTRFFFDLACGSVGPEEGNGRGLRAARLRAQAGEGHRRISLQIEKNRPGAGSAFEAEITEKRGRIEIQRSVSGSSPAGAFSYDPLLRTATVSLPAPFSGHAAFRRDAAPANRWRGDLAVDFPGDSDVSLTGKGMSVFLVPTAFRRD